jgi:hypothetical protein
MYVLTKKGIVRDMSPCKSESRLDHDFLEHDIKHNIMRYVRTLARHTACCCLSMLLWKLVLGRRRNFIVVRVGCRILNFNYI